jgi:glycosidase
VNGKIIIYQTFPRLSGNRRENPVPGSPFTINGVGKFGFFNEDELLRIKNLGCTHVWFTGIIEHATQTPCLDKGCFPDPPEIVKGIAGSPYAVKDYYDVAHYLANNHDNRIEEFEELVSRCHSADLKVIIDFVPNHISRNYKSDKNPGPYKDFGVDDDVSLSFSPQNDHYYIPDSNFISPDSSVIQTFNEVPAKATGNNCFSERPSKTDWYETVKLNYGIDYQSGGNTYFKPYPPVWEKMKHILQYWAEKGVDGFRCDMAEMVPAEFWSYAISSIKAQYADLIFIAEIYNPSKYSSFLASGFDLLYDKVGLYDTVIDIIKGNKKPSDISGCWQSLGEIQQKMLNFLENHDEQRVASDYVAGLPERALPAVAVSLLLNRASFLIYYGQELGERGMDSEGFSTLDGRTTIFDFWSLQILNDYYKGKYNNYLYNEYKFLLNIAVNEIAIREGDTFDLQYANESSSYYNSNRLFSFARRLNTELILVIVNFSDYKANGHLNIPEHLFSHWNIANNVSRKFFNLKSGLTGYIDLSSNKSIEFSVEGYSYSIIKLLLE